MGSKVKGIIVARREADSDLNGSVRELKELKTAEKLTETLSDAPITERAREYRDRIGDNASGIGKKDKPAVSEKSEDTGGKISGEGGALFIGSDDEEEKPKEIAFFSEPKRVKKKTQRSIFIFQSAVCAAVCLIMLISKLAVPQLYENLHIYLTRLFGC